MGEGVNEDYEIHYFEDEIQFLEAMEDQSHAVLYLPQDRFSDAEALLDHPEHFLFDSGPDSWLHLYGAEAFARITLHAYKVAMSHVETLTFMPPQDAFARIRSHYSAARPKIRKLLTEE